MAYTLAQVQAIDDQLFLMAAHVTRAESQYSNPNMSTYINLNEVLACLNNNSSAANTSVQHVIGEPRGSRRYAIRCLLDTGVMPPRQHKYNDGPDYYMLNGYDFNYFAHQGDQWVTMPIIEGGPMDYLFKFKANPVNQWPENTPQPGSGGSGTPGPNPPPSMGWPYHLVGASQADIEAAYFRGEITQDQALKLLEGWTGPDQPPVTNPPTVPPGPNPNPNPNPNPPPVKQSGGMVAVAALAGAAILLLSRKKA